MNKSRYVWSLKFITCRQPIFSTAFNSVTPPKHDSYAFDETIKRNKPAAPIPKIVLNKIKLKKKHEVSLFFTSDNLHENIDYR